MAKSQERKPELEAIMRTLVIVSGFVAPYFWRGWLRFPLGTLLLLTAIPRWDFGKISALFERRGLKVWLPTALTAAGICFAVTTAEAFAAQGLEVEVVRALDAGDLFEHTFQVVHQEIVIRIVLLGLALRFLRNAWLAIVVVAFVFSGMHELAYRISGDGVGLGANLAMFGISLGCNAAALHMGHVAVAFGLHLGWNWVRFSANYAVAGELVNEAQGFQLVEGSTLVSTLMVAIGLGLLIVFRPRAEASGKDP